MNDFDYIFATIRQNVTLKPAPFTTAYQCLIFCIISLRTKDEVSYPRSKALFLEAPDAKTMSTLSFEAVANLIYPAGFFKRKAEEIVTLSRDLVTQDKTDPPNSLEELLKIKGVGLKTANLVLSRGFGIPAICVDIHVHRIANRMGWIVSRSPNESEALLRETLPQKWWIESNDLLVHFGQQICKPVHPRCGQCPFDAYCPKNLTSV